ncbi:MAG: Short-chain dehydrogenase/reductase SDR, partial [uncultured Solirubrobacteraceae bacterium]
DRPRRQDDDHVRRQSRHRPRDRAARRVRPRCRVRCRGTDLRALRCRRHRRQQRQRDRRQPEHDDRDEALRPHAGCEHARHVSVVAHLRALPARCAQPACPDAQPAAEPRPEVYGRHLAYTLAKFGM